VACEPQFVAAPHRAVGRQTRGSDGRLWGCPFRNEPAYALIGAGAPPASSPFPMRAHAGACAVQIDKSDGAFSMAVNDSIGLWTSSCALSRPFPSFGLPTEHMLCAVCLNVPAGTLKQTKPHVCLQAH